MQCACAILSSVACLAVQYFSTSYICSCLFVCLFVCLYLIQIRISEAISTELRTRLPLHLDEVVGYVWALNIPPFLPLQLLYSRAGAKFSAEDGCRLQGFPLNRYIRDSGNRACDVTGVTFAELLHKLSATKSPSKGNCNYPRHHGHTRLPNEPFCFLQGKRNSTRNRDLTRVPKEPGCCL
jgi:hypothetical protein